MRALKLLLLTGSAALSFPALAQEAPAPAAPPATPTTGAPQDATPSRASDGAAVPDAADATTAQTDDVTGSAVGTTDIIVTAQRRAERVQDIPIAISVVGEKEIRSGGIVSFQQIAPRTPGFYFGSFGAVRPQLYIRGIGTRSFDPGSESSVGVFVDDVYLGRSSGSFGSLKDLQRIEVVRGPQGTLYGRNTIAGAINVITAGPTKEFEGRAEVGVSNYGGHDMLAAAGGPLNEDGSISMRVAGWYAQRDGYVRNIFNDSRWQGIDNVGGRVRLRLEPTDRLRVDLTAEVIHDGDDAAFGGFAQGTGPSAAGAPANPGAVFFAAPGRTAILPARDLRSGANNVDPTLDRTAQSYVGRIEYDVPGATFTAISGYRKLRVIDSRDQEGSSLDVLIQTGRERSKQFTQEIRLTSDPKGPLSFGGALDWIVGGFYYDDKSFRSDTFDVGLDSTVRAAARTRAVDVAGSNYDYSSYALFGQATWHVTGALDLTVGGRYTRDKKAAVQFGTTTDALPLIAAPFTTANEAVYKSFDPKVVLAYKFTPNFNVYASYSTGFKSGGFQYVPFTAAAANQLFDPEDIKAYEVGFKSELLDRRVTFNVAGYYYDYTDLQVSRIVDGGGAPVTVISNAASSTIKGVDVELTARPIPGLEFGLAYAYIDAKYDRYVFNATTDFSDTRLVRAPKNSFNLSGEYAFPVGPGQIILRADYHYTSRFFHEPGQGDNRFGSVIPLTVEPSYDLLDLRVAYEQDGYRLTGFMTNATDTVYRRSVNAIGSTAVGFAGEPRIYGLRLAKNF